MATILGRGQGGRSGQRRGRGALRCAGLSKLYPLPPAGSSQLCGRRNLAVDAARNVRRTWYSRCSEPIGERGRRQLPASRSFVQHGAEGPKLCGGVPAFPPRRSANDGGVRGAREFSNRFRTPGPLGSCDRPGFLARTVSVEHGGRRATVRLASAPGPLVDAWRSLTRSAGPPRCP